MPTAPATMATFLLGFRINHRGPSPGNDRWLFPKWKTPRLVVAAGQGGEGLVEAVQGQEVDGPADFRLAAVKVEQGCVVPGPAAGNILRLVDGAQLFVQVFDTFVDGFIGGHGSVLFLRFRVKFQPSFPPPMAARRCEI